jgi:hypothetical protein
VEDNDWWLGQATKVDRNAVRARWSVPDSAAVVLFCAKLQQWKRPSDALQAFAAADVPGSYLVFAGSGPLGPQLDADAKRLTSVASRKPYKELKAWAIRISCFRNTDMARRRGFGAIAGLKRSSNRRRCPAVR